VSEIAKSFEIALAIPKKVFYLPDDTTMLPYLGKLSKSLLQQ